MSEPCPHCGIEFVCPDCGSEDVFTTWESEPFYYREDPPTYIVVPVLNCRICHATWTDCDAEQIRTRHQFLIEKGLGITRTKFVDDAERKIYEKVQAGA